MKHRRSGRPVLATAVTLLVNSRNQSWRGAARPFWILNSA